jgi:hypothetical protein
MKAIGIFRPLCAALVVLTGLAGCSRFETGHDEMSWARAALERNDRLELVASDPQASTFTVRVKDTGELRVVRLDQVVAGPPSAVGTAGNGASAPVAAAPTESPAAAAAPSTPAPVTAATPEPNRAAATADASSAAAPATPTEPRVAATDGASDATQPPRSESASGATPGRLLASGPGYTIKAADSRGTRAARTNGAGPSTAADVERRHEPIICQGDRFMQIDNRNLEFDGDAVSAEDGCEIHITNSRISAKGIGILARKANVHIENSQIEGDSGSVNASQGAQVYSASSSFKGLRRREDDAAFHDLGGNVWN